MQRRGCFLERSAEVVPKGLEDSAWGVNPGCHKETRRPEGRGRIGVAQRGVGRPGNHVIWRPFMARQLFGRLPGVKTRAESYNPFGIDPTVQGI